MESSITISDNKWIALFSRRTPNNVDVKQGISINGNNVCPIHITAFTYQENLPWSWFGLAALTLDYSFDNTPCHTVIVADATHSKKVHETAGRVIEDALSTAISNLETTVSGIQKTITEIFTKTKYLRYSEAKKFIDAYASVYADSLASANHLQTNTLLTHDHHQSVKNIKNSLKTISTYINDCESCRTKSNKSYLDFYRVQDAEFFKTVESSKLTEEQIDAALTFEDATLVGAAAGSGKSSCIVGKIGFALKNNLFNDDEIIALAYNEDAAKSLAGRLEKNLSPALNRKIKVRSKTFHGFGLSILAEHYGKDSPIDVLDEKGTEKGRCIKSAIEKLITHDSEFQTLVSDWICYAAYESPQPIGISDDLEECQKLYEACCLERIQARKDSTRKPYFPTIPTFDNDLYVRSLEERSIANWLLLRGVEYSYEKPNYDGGKRLGLPKSDAGKQRPYNPDFTYTLVINPGSETPTTLTIIHEHFGLDEHGRAPDWMGGVKYEEQAKSKREMLVQWIEDTSRSSNRIAFFETRSSQVRDGSIWNFLETTLKRYGISINEPSQEIRDRAVNNFRESKRFENTIIDFVMSYKDSGLQEKEVFERAQCSVSPYRATQFLKIAFMVIDAYQDALNGRIDFPDMLRMAIDILNQPSDKTYPKFILVDEFQDISHLRASLVKALLDTQPNDSLVFFVGDDWQTINRFSGSDVSIFTGAANYFSRHTALLDLTKTFRCRKGIAEVSRDIVLNNKNQSQKQVIANDPVVTNEIRVIFHGPTGEDRRDTIHEALRSIIDTAAQHLSETIKDRLPTVFLLTRTAHKNTIPEGLDKELLKRIAAQYKQDLDIRPMKIHGSKGLEADFIIMIGLESGQRGFPDERAAEPLFDLILPTLTSSIEEERRLFYVGLTRARHQAIILSNAERPSPFIFELDKLKGKFACIEWVTNGMERMPCPKCNVGSLIQHKGTDVCSRIHACGYRQKHSKALKEMKVFTG